MRVKEQSHSFLLIIQYIVFSTIILYFGKSLFIPLSFALLISCVLYPFCAWLEQHKIGRIWAIIIAMSLLTLLVCSIVFLLVYQLVAFYKDWPRLQLKLSTALYEVSRWLTLQFDIDEARQMAWLKKQLNDSGGNAMQLLKNLISTSTVWAVLAILIPVYSVLILYYRHKWLHVLYRLFPVEGRERIREILKLSIESYYNFIKGMLLVYLIVAILNTTGLYFLGIPHALLFGFVASILTFIPYVGIIAASLLPISMAWITYNSIWYPLGVVGIFLVVQYLEANLIFPLAVSSRLRINTFATLVVIIAGGIVWGVAGMILFIPFLGILKLIADRTPSLKTLAIMLGGESD